MSLSVMENELSQVKDIFPLMITWISLLQKKVYKCDEINYGLLLQCTRSDILFGLLLMNALDLEAWMLKPIKAEVLFWNKQEELLPNLCIQINKASTWELVIYF